MLQRFISDNRNADVAQLALQRKRYPMLSDSDFRFCLQQIEGRQRTRDKLPLFATVEGWLYPPRLNLEQCSSERTARFKAALLAQLSINRQSSMVSCQLLIDATGGYGVDTFFMSEQADETHYFEQNTELAAVATHNFCLAGKSVHCHAEPFGVNSLSTLIGPLSGEHASVVGSKTVLYIDPARRDSHGGKVFRLEDCTPDVTDIVHYVQRDCPSVRVLLKLSPMLDFHQAVARLGGSWDVYVVSVANEVKELLLLSGGTGAVHAVALSDEGAHILTFMPGEEAAARASLISRPPTFNCIYEPNAAVLKAGAYKLLSERYGLTKADVNTHLYFAETPEAFRAVPLPGRTWQVLGVYSGTKELKRALIGIKAANVLTRNYVMTADALHKNLRLKDGGDEYIIGCRIADKPLLLHCRRIG